MSHDDMMSGIILLPPLGEGGGEGLLFLAQLPVQYGQDGDNEDEGADAAGEDGDAHWHPEGCAGDDHGDDADGRGGGGEEDGHHTPVAGAV